MLPTYEAILQPNCGLEFSDGEPPKFAHAQRVLVTVLPNQPPAAGRWRGAGETGLAERAGPAERFGHFQCRPIADSTRDAQ